MAKPLYTRASNTHIHANTHANKHIQPRSSMAMTNCNVNGARCVTKEKTNTCTRRLALRSANCLQEQPFPPPLFFFFFTLFARTS